MIKTEIKDYLNYGKVLAISNDIIEAYVTIDVGPRIIASEKHMEELR